MSLDGEEGSGKGFEWKCLGIGMGNGMATENTNANVKKRRENSNYNTGQWYFSHYSALELYCMLIPTRKTCICREVFSKYY